MERSSRLTMLRTAAPLAVAAVLLAGGAGLGAWAMKIMDRQSRDLARMQVAVERLRGELANTHEARLRAQAIASDEATSTRTTLEALAKQAAGVELRLNGLAGEIAAGVGASGAVLEAARLAGAEVARSITERDGDRLAALAAELAETKSRLSLLDQRSAAQADLQVAGANALNLLDVRMQALADLTARLSMIELAVKSLAEGQIANANTLNTLDLRTGGLQDIVNRIATVELAARALLDASVAASNNANASGQSLASLSEQVTTLANEMNLAAAGLAALKSQALEIAGQQGIVGQQAQTLLEAEVVRRNEMAATSIRLEAAQKTIGDIHNQLNLLEVVSKQHAEALAALPRMSASERDQHTRVFQKLYPDFTAAEIALLTDDEIRINTVRAQVSKAPLPRDVSWDRSGTDARGGPAIYIDGRGQEVRIDASLPVPSLTVTAASSAYPEVTVPERSGWLHYFEFDTTPAFDSPNLWRWPTLIPEFDRQDIDQRAALRFSVFRTSQRNADGRAATVRFPFRASAMRLPNDWKALDFTEMQKQARALAYGITDEDKIIAEHFAFVRQLYVWADDTRMRPAIDTFARGMGECGYISDLLGTMLEMNGVRYRGVAGFDPTIRSVVPDRGHSVIEVWRSAAGGWTYADPFLDVLIPGVSARDLRHRDELQQSHFNLPRALADRGFPARLTMREQFRFRSYFDMRGRLPTTSMAALRGDEDGFGRDWALEIAPEFTRDALFASSRRIYVRARYIEPERAGVRLDGSAENTEGARRASPWGVTSFEIRPAELATRGAGAAARKVGQAN